MNGIFKKGSKEPLEESDICEVLERDSAYHLATKLQRYSLLIDLKITKKTYYRYILFSIGLEHLYF
jgi:hypothetical protein